MTNFLLGMATMYFLFNLMVVIYIVITEGREILKLKKNKFKIILVVLSMFFVGVPFVVINRDIF
jgi:integral membrane sensor domain MASE1